MEGSDDHTIMAFSRSLSFQFTAKSLLKVFFLPLILLSSGGCDRTDGLSADSALPIIIGHRGASGERPEHTRAAYELAIEQGADYIEPDLVMSKDGILMVRHENEISQTTNVATKRQFAARFTTKVIDGQEISGWFTEDFTYNELKTLRAKERLPELRNRNRDYDNEFSIMSFQELLKFVQLMERRTGRVIGVYPELKHPSYFKSIGLPQDQLLVKQLNSFGYRDASDAVFIQSFEVGTLETLSEATDIRLIQLIGGEGTPPDRPNLNFSDMVTAAGLRRIARYADGIGVDKSHIIGRNILGRLGGPSGVVKNAKSLDLLVHAWTFRGENYFLPEGMKSSLNPAEWGDMKREIKAYRDAGVDGFFTDHPDLALTALNEY